MKTPQGELKNKQRQSFFFGVLVMLFVAVLIFANISASNTFSLNDYISLSAAELLFPISYVINDLLAEFYGAKTTNKIVIVGLGVVLLGNVFMFLTTLLPSGYTEYQTVFGHLTSGIVGITISSIVAYGAGSCLNAFVLTKMKKHAGQGKNKSSKFFARAILSSVVAEVCDSLVFITLCCLLAPEYYAWSKLLQFVLTISAIKLLVELILFPITDMIRKTSYKKGLVQENKEQNNETPRQDIF